MSNKGGSSATALVSRPNPRSMWTQNLLMLALRTGMSLPLISSIKVRRKPAIWTSNRSYTGQHSDSASRKVREKVSSPKLFFDSISSTASYPISVEGLPSWAKIMAPGLGTRLLRANVVESNDSKY